MGSPYAFDTILSSNNATYTVGTGTLIAANSARKFVGIVPNYVSGSWSMRLSTSDPCTSEDWLAFYYSDGSAVAATGQHITRNLINMMRPLYIFTTSALYYNIGSNSPVLTVTEFG